MGCKFNCVAVPPNVQREKNLVKFYTDYRERLLAEYGGKDFDGYSGDLAVDNGHLVVRKDLKLEALGELTQKDIDEQLEGLLELCEQHCEKWGPSIAVRLGNQWVICGFYSN